MVTFRNNNNNIQNRRNNFRRNDRSFKSNTDRPKFGSNFTNNDKFKRKAPGRNNHNAPKLIEKYNDLAREALSNGDKILSENYLQYADHFMRIQNERENYRKEKFIEKIENEVEVSEDSSGDIDEDNDQKSNILKDSTKEDSEDANEVKNSAKP